MAINTEITRIAGAKADIKSAIEAKGVSVPSNALIDSYDDYVAQISGGGGNQDLVDLIEGDITTLNIPSGVTGIRQDAFYKCSTLTSIIIPSSVTSIGKEAFYGCTSLTSIIIPSSVTSISDYLFSGCSSLTTITIPSSVTSIDNNAFTNCSALTSVVIPSSVTSMGSYVFNSCTFSSITCLATTPPIVGSKIFYNCNNLAHIYVPSGSVNDYKAASGWSAYASIIEAIPSA